MNYGGKFLIMRRLSCFLHKKRKIVFKILGILFFIYSWLMIWEVFIGPYRSYSSVRRYNIYPLKTIRDYLVNSDQYNFSILFINLAANIVTFIPLGFFTCILFKRFNNLTSIAIFSVLITTIIEVMQFTLNVGVCDIDDIILNTLGCIIGFVLNKMMRYVLHMK
jgi:glycopeptide antibiotics resistance protein